QTGVEWHQIGTGDHDRHLDQCVAAQVEAGHLAIEPDQKITHAIQPSVTMASRATRTAYLAHGEGKRWLRLPRPHPRSTQRATGRTERRQGTPHVTSTRSPRRANARRLILLVVVTAAVVAAQVWYGNRHHFLDLRIYVNAVRWWASGHPLYEFAHDDPIQGRLGFTYPPFAALVLISTLEPIRETVTFGQINMLLVLLVLTDLLVVAPRWPRLAGIGIGIA